MNTGRINRRDARTPGIRAAFISLCLWGFVVASASASDGPRHWAILVSGVSGDPELQEHFLKLTRDFRTSLEGSLQFPRNQIVVLFDDPAKDPELIQHQSSRENLEKVSRDLAGRVGKDDLVFVFIMGHGNFDSKGYKLNLPGPDPTAEELALILYAIPAQRFVVVNTTTCSGGSISALAKKGKIIVTATKSGQEKNQTHMAQFFVEAFKEGNADVDKNGRVSVLEAFTYATRKVEEYYNKEGNIQTEHPVLEDSGDGKPNAQPGPENGEGLLARTTYLDSRLPSAAKGKTSSEEGALALEAQALEKQIEALKYTKGEMPEAEYEKKLEALLIKLAQINAKLRKNQ
jgi:hypothetical protein